MDRKFNNCVFCLSPKLKESFSKLILNKYEIEYQECQNCGSLQISEVYWLKEAYSELPFNLDTWVAQRCIRNVLFVKALRSSDILSCNSKCLDFGAGSGLLVRLLRDQGFDAYAYDKHSDPLFCKNFTFRNMESIKDEKFDLIIALEVMEHLVQPSETLRQLDSILSTNGVIFVSTTCYDKNTHDENWDYLISEGGQHINFASREGMRILAKSHNLETMFLPHEISLLFKQESSVTMLTRYKTLFYYRLYIAMAKCLRLLDFKNCENDNKMIFDQIVKNYN